MAEHPRQLPQGRLGDNIVHFARLLRAAGLPIGPGRTLTAFHAVKAAGLGDKQDFYWALYATLVSRREHHEIFDQAFHIFWQKRNLTEKMMQMLLPEQLYEAPPKKPRAGAQRLAEALMQGASRRAPQREEMEIEARATMSGEERLQTKDFEQMSAEELRVTKQVVARLALPDDFRKLRRTAPSSRGRLIDARATLRASLRSGGGLIELKYKAPRRRRVPIVAIIDISGSMSQYSRVMLHFMHALGRARPGVHSFLFGTRLTNVTRHLTRKDPDEAMDEVATAVADWSGGTRISTSLEAFNKHWSRRVLGQGATVLLISDGLEREEGEGLSRQMERLAKSCRRLIWLNPLLRYEGFKARAGGIRAMLPHVDAFRPVHNLESLADLAAALERPAEFSPSEARHYLQEGAALKSA